MLKNGKITWRKKARKILAEAFGNACGICGYDKCIAAFDYHHLDPDGKDNLLSKAMVNGHSWEKIVTEARKCVLLCCRCHREVHSGITSIPDNIKRFDENYANSIFVKEKEYSKCLMCDNMKIKRYKFCSQECAQLATVKFDIDKESLESIIKTSSYEEIGRIYGVTGICVKKRAIKLGIKLQRRKKNHV